VFLTWRLNGSLPDEQVLTAAATAEEAFTKMDRRLDDARDGACHLRQPEIARMVVDAIYHHAKRLRYFDLHAFVVMANHVHLLVTPLVPLPKLAASLKRLTAREAAHRIDIRGPFWQEEGYQREVRDDAELQQIASEIEMEPVRAGMVCTPGEFPWTSAAID
jgi:REP element-mobilizing transposase RayT